MFAWIRDISDKKRAQEEARFAQQQLEYRAAHDSLTRLGNREQLHKHINAIINSKTDADSTLAPLLLDLIRFKEVNNTPGHATGDHVLVKLAKTLDEQVTAIGRNLSLVFQTSWTNLHYQRCFVADNLSHV